MKKEMIDIIGNAVSRVFEVLGIALIAIVLGLFLISSCGVVHVDNEIQGIKNDN